MQIIDTNSMWKPNHAILTSSVNAIMKGMNWAVFLGPTLGVVRILYIDKKFFQQLRLRWLAGLSHMHYFDYENNIHYTLTTLIKYVNYFFLR